MDVEDMGGKKILIVEDEYLIAADMALQFEQWGVAVIGPAANVAKALALIAETEGLDGAVLDVNLQDGVVYPVADALREKGVPYVFATGYDRVDLPERYRDAPQHEKPIDPEQVMRSLLAGR